MLPMAHLTILSHPWIVWVQGARVALRNPNIRSGSNGDQMIFTMQKLNARGWMHECTIANDRSLPGNTSEHSFFFNFYSLIWREFSTCSSSLKLGHVSTYGAHQVYNHCGD